eukprot:GEZU01042493.1.p1 GENE.GEZU01042493.1~~GEZU01042493.1.p1  ORF type:complete len:117 (+),score=1.07 GEZU01042493.1:50-400(+)
MSNGGSRRSISPEPMINDNSESDRHHRDSPMERSRSPVDSRRDLDIEREREREHHERDDRERHHRSNEEGRNDFHHGETPSKILFVRIMPRGVSDRVLEDTFRREPGFVEIRRVSY